MEMDKDKVSSVEINYNNDPIRLTKEDGGVLAGYHFQHEIKKHIASGEGVKQEQPTIHN